MTRIAIFFVTVFFSAALSAAENVFYVLHYKNNPAESQKIVDTVSAHHDAIQVLISQAFLIKKDGTVSGYYDQSLFNYAKKNNIKFLAMVTNAVFDNELSHKFFTNKKAQEKALKSLIDICKQNHFDGVQLDIEMVWEKDKEALTHFYQEAFDLLHKNGFIVSIAIPPVISDGPFNTAYQKRLYKNAGGAYDLKKIGNAADFVTLMAYDQHFGRVTPGAVAGYSWMEASIKHTLKLIPENKISLGIPTYSRFWYTGKDSTGQIRIQNDTLSYATAMKIINKNNAPLFWDKYAKVPYSFYEHNGLNEFMFIEDAASIQAKLNLVSKYHLRGASFFRIGTEDPAIWKIITNK